MKIEDIAKLAGVSKSAVSLALNGRDGLSEHTRQRILGIAAEHNYVPLRKSNKKDEDKLDIRLVVAKSADLITDYYRDLPFFSELINFLFSEISHSRYSLSISTFEESTLIKELKEIEAEQPSSGLIVLGTNLSLELTEQLTHEYKTLVFLDTHFQEIYANFVSINNFQGGYQAADHLISLGHTKIGYVLGTPRIQNFEERFAGFKKRLKREGLKLDDNYIFSLPAMRINGGESLKEQFLKLDQLPTAIFCENDYMAITMIKLLQSLSINVPESIAIIGFDNISESSVITPELTTIQVKKSELAKQALELLDQQIRGRTPRESKHIQINTQLIERNSTLNQA